MAASDRVCLDPGAVEVQGAERSLGGREALLGRRPIPTPRRRVVAGDAAAPEVEQAQAVLGRRVALLGREPGSSGRPRRRPAARPPRRSGGGPSQPGRPRFPARPARAGRPEAGRRPSAAPPPPGTLPPRRRRVGARRYRQRAGVAGPRLFQVSLASTLSPCPRRHPPGTPTAPDTDSTPDPDFRCQLRVARPNTWGAKLPHEMSGGGARSSFFGRQRHWNPMTTCAPRCSGPIRPRG